MMEKGFINLTIKNLEYCLKKELSVLFKNQRFHNSRGKLIPINIFEGEVPMQVGWEDINEEIALDLNDDNNAPYIICSIVSGGRDKNDLKPMNADVVFTICTCSLENTLSGRDDVMLILQRIIERFDTNRILYNYYCKRGYDWRIGDDSRYPFFKAGLIMHFELPTYENTMDYLRDDNKWSLFLNISNCNINMFKGKYRLKEPYKIKISAWREFHFNPYILDILHSERLIMPETQPGSNVYEYEIYPELPSEFVVIVPEYKITYSNFIDGVLTTHPAGYYELYKPETLELSTDLPGIIKGVPVLKVDDQYLTFQEVVRKRLYRVNFIAKKSGSVVNVDVRPDYFVVKLESYIDEDRQILIEPDDLVQEITVGIEGEINIIVSMIDENYLFGSPKDQYIVLYEYIFNNEKKELGRYNLEPYNKLVSDKYRISLPYNVLETYNPRPNLIEIHSNSLNQTINIIYKGDDFCEKVSPVYDVVTIRNKDESIDFRVRLESENYIWEDYKEYIVFKNAAGDTTNTYNMKYNAISDDYTLKITAKVISFTIPKTIEIYASIVKYSFTIRFYGDEFCRIDEPVLGKYIVEYGREGTIKFKVYLNRDPWTWESAEHQYISLCNKDGIEFKKINLELNFFENSYEAEIKYDLLEDYVFTVENIFKDGIIKVHSKTKYYKINIINNVDHYSALMLPVQLEHLFHHGEEGEIVFRIGLLDPVTRMWEPGENLLLFYNDNDILLREINFDDEAFEENLEYILNYNEIKELNTQNIRIKVKTKTVNYYTFNIEFESHTLNDENHPDILISPIADHISLRLSDQGELAFVARTLKPEYKWRTYLRPRVQLLENNIVLYTRYMEEDADHHLICILPYGIITRYKPTIIKVITYSVHFYRYEVIYNNDEFSEINSPNAGLHLIELGTEDHINFRASLINNDNNWNFPNFNQIVFKYEDEINRDINFEFTEVDEHLERSILYNEINNFENVNIIDIECDTVPVYRVELKFENENGGAILVKPRLIIPIIRFDITKNYLFDILYKLANERFVWNFNQAQIAILRNQDGEELSSWRFNYSKVFKTWNCLFGSNEIIDVSPFNYNLILTIYPRVHTKYEFEVKFVGHNGTRLIEPNIGQYSVDILTYDHMLSFKTGVTEEAFRSWEDQKYQCVLILENNVLKNKIQMHYDMFEDIYLCDIDLDTEIDLNKKIIFEVNAVTKYASPEIRFLGMPGTHMNSPDEGVKIIYDRQEGQLNFEIILTDPDEFVWTNQNDQKIVFIGLLDQEIFSINLEYNEAEDKYEYNLNYQVIREYDPNFIDVVTKVSHYIIVDTVINLLDGYHLTEGLVGINRICYPSDRIYVFEFTLNNPDYNHYDENQYHQFYLKDEVGEVVYEVEIWEKNNNSIIYHIPTNIFIEYNVSNITISLVAKTRYQCQVRFYGDDFCQLVTPGEILINMTAEEARENPINFTARFLMNQWCWANQNKRYIKFLNREEVTIRRNIFEIFPQNPNELCDLVNLTNIAKAGVISYIDVHALTKYIYLRIVHINHSGDLGDTVIIEGIDYEETSIYYNEPGQLRFECHLNPEIENIRWNSANSQRIIFKNEDNEPWKTELLIFDVENNIFTFNLNFNEITQILDLNPDDINHTAEIHTYANTFQECVIERNLDRYTSIVSPLQNNLIIYNIDQGPLYFLIKINDEVVNERYWTYQRDNYIELFNNQGEVVSHIGYTIRYNKRSEPLIVSVPKEFIFAEHITRIVVTTLTSTRSKHLFLRHLDELEFTEVWIYAAAGGNIIEINNVDIDDGFAFYTTAIDYPILITAKLKEEDPLILGANWNIADRQYLNVENVQGIARHNLEYNVGQNDYNYIFPNPEYFVENMNNILIHTAVVTRFIYEVIFVSNYNYIKLTHPFDSFNEHITRKNYNIEIINANIGIEVEFLDQYKNYLWSENEQYVDIIHEDGPIRRVLLEYDEEDNSYFTFIRFDNINPITFRNFTVHAIPKIYYFTVELINSEYYTLYMLKTDEVNEISARFLLIKIILKNNYELWDNANASFRLDEVEIRNENLNIIVDQGKSIQTNFPLHEMDVDEFDSIVITGNPKFFRFNIEFNGDEFCQLDYPVQELHEMYCKKVLPIRVSSTVRPCEWEIPEFQNVVCYYGEEVIARYNLILVNNCWELNLPISELDHNRFDRIIINATTKYYEFDVLLNADIYCRLNNPIIGHHKIANSDNLPIMVSMNRDPWCWHDANRQYVIWRIGQAAHPEGRANLIYEAETKSYKLNFDLRNISKDVIKQLVINAATKFNSFDIVTGGDELFYTLHNPATGHYEEYFNKPGELNFRISINDPGQYIWDSPPKLNIYQNDEIIKEYRFIPEGNYIGNFNYTYRQIDLDMPDRIEVYALIVDLINFTVVSECQISSRLNKPVAKAYQIKSNSEGYMEFEVEIIDKVNYEWADQAKLVIFNDLGVEVRSINMNLTLDNKYSIVYNYNEMVEDAVGCIRVRTRTSREYEFEVISNISEDIHLISPQLKKYKFRTGFIGILHFEVELDDERYRKIQGIPKLVFLNSEDIVLREYNMNAIDYTHYQYDLEYRLVEETDAKKINIVASSTFNNYYYFTVIPILSEGTRLISPRSNYEFIKIKGNTEHTIFRTEINDNNNFRWDGDQILSFINHKTGQEIERHILGRNGSARDRDFINTFIEEMGSEEIRVITNVYNRNNFFGYTVISRCDEDCHIDTPQAGFYKFDNNKTGDLIIMIEKDNHDVAWTKIKDQTIKLIDYNGNEIPKATAELNFIYNSHADSLRCKTTYQYLKNIKDLDVIQINGFTTKNFNKVSIINNFSFYPAIIGVDVIKRTTPVINDFNIGEFEDDLNIYIKIDLIDGFNYYWIPNTIRLEIKNNNSQTISTRNLQYIAETDSYEINLNCLTFPEGTRYLIIYASARHYDQPEP